MWRATWSSLMGHKLRLGLTALAIVLGVGFVAGTFVLTDTLNHFFESVFSEANAEIDVEVRPSQSAAGGSGADLTEGVPAEVLDKVRAVDGVRIAAGLSAGFAQFEARDGKAIGGQGPPTLGFSWVEAEGAADIAPVRIRAGRPPRTPDEVAMDVVTAKNHDFEVGDRVRVRLIGPARHFTIVGLIGFGRADNLGGATIAMFELETAQRLFDSVGRYDSIAVAAEEGVATSALIERIEPVLPRGVEAVSGQQAADDSAADVKQGIRFLGTAILFFAAIALFVGSFIVANTFGIVLAQRTRELGLLRALGATGGQVMRSVLVESALVGLLASFVGVGFGILLGAGLRVLVEQISGGASLPGAQIRVLPRTVYGPVLLGTTVTVLAAIIPARRAARLTPIDALQSATTSDDAVSATRVVTGAVLLALGAVVGGYAMFGQSVPLRFAVLGAGGILLFVGVGLAAPAIARPTASALGRPLPLVAGVAGRLAGANARRNPGRTSSTAAALTIGLAVITAVSLLSESIKRSTDVLLDELLKADFVLYAEGMAGQIGPEVTGRLRERNEVATVVNARYDQWKDGDRTRTLTAIAHENVHTVVELGMREGSPAALADGGVLVHEDVAKSRGLRTGGTLRMELPRTGPIDVPIDGIYTERRLIDSSYILSMHDYDRGYTSRNDSLIFVRTVPGYTAAQVGAAVQEVLRDFPAVVSRNNQEFKEEQSAQLDTLVALVTALLGLAIVIAFLGIANTLALSIVERTRELGLLRAVGMTRRQVRRMVRWEAVVIALFGAVLGVVVGLGVGVAAVRALADEGITRLGIPVGQLAVLVVTAGLAGMVAAALPARRAGRLDVLAAITYE